MVSDVSHDADIVDCFIMCCILSKVIARVLNTSYDELLGSP